MPKAIDTIVQLNRKLMSGIEYCDRKALLQQCARARHPGRARAYNVNHCGKLDGDTRPAAPPIAPGFRLAIVLLAFLREYKPSGTEIVE
jgi:hypothetical protein